jgi:Tol biopolymer transport system component
MVVGVLAAALSAGLVACGGVSQTGLIAFARNRGEGFEIYVIRADGSGLRRLNHVGNNESPVWSPNGKRLAFTSYSRQIWVVDVDGTRLRQLTRVRDNRDPAWSPDGRRIAYTSRLDGIIPEIWLMNSDGSDQHQLTHDPAGAREPHWLAGGRLMFTANHRAVVIRDPDGTERQLIASATDPTPSPNRTQIAYTNERGIAVINADGSHQRQLTREGGTEIAWSPDGEELAFIGEGVEVVTATGNNRRNLTRQLREPSDPSISVTYFSPSWSPDAKDVLFERDLACASDCSSYISGSLYVVAAAGGGKVRRLTTHGTNMNDTNPAWQPG